MLQVGKPHRVCLAQWLTEPWASVPPSRAPTMTAISPSMVLYVRFPATTKKYNVKTSGPI